MKFNNPRNLLLLPLAALFALGACSPKNDRTAGQSVDTAVAKTEKAAERGKEESMDVAARAKAAGERVAEETKAMGAVTADKVDDAAITTNVKAAIAAEKDLSAARIGVDTSNGKVTLSGPVPTIAARGRATEVAGKVKGVTSVN
ncbi:MAG: BON domain-containing protein, partial [Ramlibacter sp.]